MIIGNVRGVGGSQKKSGPQAPVGQLCMHSPKAALISSMIYGKLIRVCVFTKHFNNVSAFPESENPPN